MVLAGLYTIRLFGGGEATGVVLSNWLLAFSMFFFVSLAFVKRVAELLALTDTSQVLGREYSITDLAVLGRMGVSAGYTSVLVLALYINSVDVLRFYRHPGACGFYAGCCFSG